MTNEEAIELLKNDIEICTIQQKQACEMAIKALEQQPKPMEKFDDVKTHIQRLAGDYKCWDNRLTWEEALELNRMLEAQPSDINISDPCDGCRYELNSTNGNPCYSCGKYKLTEQQPSEPRTNLAETSQDCISREEVQDLISIWLSDYLLDETREALETINYKVGDMPAVTPKAKRGHWTDVYREVPIYNAGGFTETRHIGWQCSECNKITPYRGDYCGDCGSYNKEGEDENNPGC